MRLLFGGFDFLVRIFAQKRYNKGVEWKRRSMLDADFHFTIYFPNWRKTVKFEPIRDGCVLAKAEPQSKKKETRASRRRSSNSR